MVILRLSVIQDALDSPGGAGPVGIPNETVDPVGGALKAGAPLPVDSEALSRMLSQGVIYDISQPVYPFIEVLLVDVEEVTGELDFIER
jgi:hypothetical protein